MTHRGPAVCLLLLFFIASAKASPAEWLTGHHLEQSCDLLLEDAGTPDGGLCLAFIQGFIAGAEASDGTVVPDTTASSRSDETYSERAARTRLGTLRMQQIQPSTRPAYCVDETTPAIEVVKKVTAYLEDHANAADLTAGDAVRKALVYSFPCQR
jgi:hypothetical protein